MEVRVLWSDKVLSQLEDIFDYYKLNASPSIAKKIVKSIVEGSTILINNPEIGRIEPLLQNRRYNYRFVIKGNYKIIYRFNDNLIRILSVFDCRQNPKKIRGIKD